MLNFWKKKKKNLIFTFASMIVAMSTCSQPHVKYYLLIHAAPEKKQQAEKARISAFFFSEEQHNSFAYSFGKRNKLMFFILTRRMPLESALQITAALLAARGHILIFLEKTLVTTGRLPWILRNKIMFLISTSCIWFEFHLQISRCRSPLATLFFSLTPRSFHRVVPSNKDFPRRNYISFAAVSRMLQAIPQQSFKRLVQYRKIFFLLRRT